MPQAPLLPIASPTLRLIIRGHSSRGYRVFFLALGLLLSSMSPFSPLWTSVPMAGGLDSSWVE